MPMWYLDIKSKIGRLAHFETLFQQYICFWSLRPLSNVSCRAVAVGHTSLQSHVMREAQVKSQLTDEHKVPNFSSCLEEQRCAVN